MVAEVQFLDNLRRGASINYADLQPNQVPQTLGDAYRLLTVASPQVGGRGARAGGQGAGRTASCCWTVSACGCLQWSARAETWQCLNPSLPACPLRCPVQVTTLENGIRILQEEVQARRIR